MRSQLLVLVAILTCSAAASAAEMVHSENFIVLAPDEAIARQVLAQAEVYRRELAREWLGEEIPSSVGRTTINVELAEGENRAFTWPADDPGRKYHKIWITASRDQAAGNILRHEVAHIVLHTRYPAVLPAWADEGIASLYDDPRRAEARRNILAWYAKAGNWPDLGTRLSARQIPADDRAGYTFAASLTQYLLSHGDKQAFLAFAIAGKRDGWDGSLEHHYGIANVAELERAWQAWIVRQNSGTSGLSARGGHYGVTTQPNSGS